LVPGSGIISPRGVLFRKDHPTCADVSEIAAESDGLPAGASLTVMIVLAVIVLVLAVLLVFLVVKERKGAPVFMPLLSKQETSEAGTFSNAT
jgi:hypothetical protein